MLHHYKPSFQARFLEILIAIVIVVSHLLRISSAKRVTSPQLCDWQEEDDLLCVAVAWSVYSSEEWTAFLKESLEYDYFQSQKHHCPVTKLTRTQQATNVEFSSITLTLWSSVLEKRRDTKYVNSDASTMIFVSFKPLIICILFPKQRRKLRHRKIKHLPYSLTW